jgi:peptide/nickel transport system permease protein
VLPNVLPTLVAYGLVFVGIAIVVEGSLSFLGLSVQAPQASWGGMIAEGQSALRTNPELSLVPACVMCLTVLSFSVLGERAKDPSGRRLRGFVAGLRFGRAGPQPKGRGTGRGTGAAS